MSSTNTSLIDNGTSLRILASNSTPVQHKSFMINFKVKASSNLGDTVKLVAIVSTTSMNFVDSCKAIIRGSYDQMKKMQRLL